MTDRIAALFPPPDAPAALYFGTVMHVRLRPVAHRFAYSVFSLLVDVDRLPLAGRLTPLFSIGRFNLLSFFPQDHGAGDARPVRAHVEALLRPAGIACSRILLLCYPRVLGFVFNPISIYYCYAEAELVALIYEVRNTFGEKHSYVAPVAAGELGEAGVRQSRDKLLYVSPFMDMAQRYHFRLQPPGARIGVRILETDAAGPIFAATFAGKARVLDSPGVLAAFFGLPLMTLKVVAGIHWEALRLWLKGMRLRSRPAPPPASSLSPAPTNIARGAIAK